MYIENPCLKKKTAGKRETTPNEQFLLFSTASLTLFGEHSIIFIKYTIVACKSLKYGKICRLGKSSLVKFVHLHNQFSYIKGSNWSIVSCAY